MMREFTNALAALVAIGNTSDQVKETIAGYVTANDRYLEAQERFEDASRAYNELEDHRNEAYEACLVANGDNSGELIASFAALTQQAGIALTSVLMAEMSLLNKAGRLDDAFVAASDALGIQPPASTCPGCGGTHADRSEADKPEVPQHLRDAFNALKGDIGSIIADAMACNPGLAIMGMSIGVAFDPAAAKATEKPSEVPAAE